MRLMLYLHSSMVQGSMAHSNNNPGVLYRPLHCGANMILGDTSYLLQNILKKDYDAEP